jgi:hypothetical protein
VRQFLLTNLERVDASSPYKFRLPLNYLSDAIDEIGEFPYAPGSRTFDKPALFLKGALRFRRVYSSRRVAHSRLVYLAQ